MRKLTPEEQDSHAAIEDSCYENVDIETGREIKQGYSGRAKFNRNSTRGSALELNSRLVLEEEEEALPLLKDAESGEDGRDVADQTINKSNWR